MSAADNDKVGDEDLAYQQGGIQQNSSSSSPQGVVRQWYSDEESTSVCSYILSKLDNGRQRYFYPGVKKTWEKAHSEGLLPHRNPKSVLAHFREHVAHNLPRFVKDPNKLRRLQACLRYLRKRKDKVPKGVKGKREGGKKKISVKLMKKDGCDKSKRSKKTHKKAAVSIEGKVRTNGGFYSKGELTKMCQFVVDKLKNWPEDKMKRYHCWPSLKLWKLAHDQGLFLKRTDHALYAAFRMKILPNLRRYVSSDEDYELVRSNLKKKLGIGIESTDRQTKNDLGVNSDNNVRGTSNNAEINLFDQIDCNSICNLQSISVQPRMRSIFEMDDGESEISISNTPRYGNNENFEGLVKKAITVEKREKMRMHNEIFHVRSLLAVEKGEKIRLEAENFQLKVDNEQKIRKADYEIAELKRELAIENEAKSQLENENQQLKRRSEILDDEKCNLLNEIAQLKLNFHQKEKEDVVNRHLIENLTRQLDYHQKETLKRQRKCYSLKSTVIQLENKIVKLELDLSKRKISSDKDIVETEQEKMDNL